MTNTDIRTNTEVSDRSALQILGFAAGWDWHRTIIEERHWYPDRYRILPVVQASRCYVAAFALGVQRRAAAYPLARRRLA